jgi:hypothetical protein
MIRHLNFNIIRKSYFSQVMKFFSSASNDTLEVPTIDFDLFLNKRPGWQDECEKVANCLHQTGILVVKDPVKN